MLTPDRVVKHNLIHYLLRGPFVGAMVIFVMLTIPKVQSILGLPRDTVLIFAVVGLIVFLQLAINRLKPVIDRITYRQDQEEISWIQTLDRRLLTTADLSSFLENTLAAMCDLLQVQTAFVAVWAGGEHRLEATCGDQAQAARFLEEQNLTGLTMAGSSEENGPGFVAADGFWLVPLHSQTSDVRLGILGIMARAARPDLEPEEQKLASLLIGKAREALEDRYLQQNVFDTLRRILSDISACGGARPATPGHRRWHLRTIQSIRLSQQWSGRAEPLLGGPKLTRARCSACALCRPRCASMGATRPRPCAWY